VCATYIHVIKTHEQGKHEEREAFVKTGNCGTTIPMRKGDESNRLRIESLLIQSLTLRGKAAMKNAPQAVGSSEKDVKVAEAEVA